MQGKLHCYRPGEIMNPNDERDRYERPYIPDDMTRREQEDA